MEQAEVRKGYIMKVNTVKFKENPVSISTKIICTLEDIYTGKKIVKEFHNVICTVGKVAIARRLAGIALLANEGQITYGATGTNTNVPAAGDTVLGTEIARKQVASSSYTSNTCEIRTFFTATESVSTLKEFGLFGENASATPDSGTLFNHAVISVEKLNTQTLTVAVVFTIA